MENQDLHPFDSEGSLPFSWTRHSILLGMVFDIFLFQKVRISPVFRFSIINDFGIIDTDDVNQHLDTFLNGTRLGSPIFDYDMIARFETGGIFSATKHLALGFLLSIGAKGLVDKEYEIKRSKLDGLHFGFTFEIRRSD